MYFVPQQSEAISTYARKRKQSQRDDDDDHDDHDYHDDQANWESLRVVNNEIASLFADLCLILVDDDP